MFERILVHRGTWFDSAFLMRVSRRLASLPGVSEATVLMGTALNKQVLVDAGFGPEAFLSATPLDLVVALRGAEEAALVQAFQALPRLLEPPKGASQAASHELPQSLSRSLAAHPLANVVSIAVPGPYAAWVAHRALDAGKHVFLFSDNVAVEDEVALKRRGAEAGLLVMGPDCGTSILNGVGLGFANRVPRGRVGIVGPSGTGIQEVSCGLARTGEGISHAIGTGGRDLKAAVGGIMTEMALRLLARDAQTQAIVLVAKHPDPAVAERIHGVLKELGKPVVVRYLGEGPGSTRDGIRYASTLDDAVLDACDLVQGEEMSLDLDYDRPLPLRPGRVVGLFSGGSLASEAAEIFLRRGIRTRVPEFAWLPGRHLPGLGTSWIIDTGDDVYTRGRPHPMVDMTWRLALVREAAKDPSVAVILADIVLGDGAHPDPASEWVPVLRDVRNVDRSVGEEPPPLVLLSLTGTRTDPQDLRAQEARLTTAGAWVFPTATLAADVASRIVSGPNEPKDARTRS